MDKEVLIKVDNVSKKFCRDLKTSLWYGVKDLTSEFFGIQKNGQLRNKEFYAVKNVSFELLRGECLGLIGHNGAGKSTLLKMLNGLIKPDYGKIEIRGRIGALIELGAGFNPILTGRENIYVNGQILGFTKKEIDEKFDDIVEFSEIKDFIDTPVQNYSSGMKVRLGFAVASQMEPDVLLIDEVLAVGDMGFILKCFNRMDSLLNNTAIVFVSHNIPQVARMSSKIMMMKKGTMEYNDNDVSKGISLYYSQFNKIIGNYVGSHEAEIEKITLRSKDRKSTDGKTFIIRYHEELIIDLKIKCNNKNIVPNIYLAFYDKAQRNFGEVMNFKDYYKSNSKFKQNEYLFYRIKFPKTELAQGLYSITIGLSDLSNNSRRNIFRVQSAIYFQVEGTHHGWAPIQFDPEWQNLVV